MKFISRHFPVFFWFCLPLLFFVVCFILIPVLGTIISSFQQDVAYLPHRFVGFENFIKILKDLGMLQAVRFTLLFTLCAVPLEMLLGLIFALLAHERTPWQGLLRVIILIPWAIPSSIAARTWELVFNFQYGIANQLLIKTGWLTAPINWLGTEAGAFWVLVLADAWKTAPFAAILILAGLQAIPEDLYAQARIDRANLWQRFTHITLPLLKPVLIVALLFRTIDTLRIFDLIYIVTRGGPGGATTSLSLYSFKYFLTSDFGFGSTVSVILFLIALALSIVYLRFSKFKEVLE